MAREMRSKGRGWQTIANVMGRCREDLQGLEAAVHVDGPLNDPARAGSGWTVELAFPWQGLGPLFAGRPLPQVAGPCLHQLRDEAQLVRAAELG